MIQHTPLRLSVIVIFFALAATTTTMLLHNKLHTTPTFNTEHQPDLIIFNAVIDTYSKEGLLKNQLSTVKTIHYPYKDKTLVTKPHIISYTKNRIPWDIRANEGQLVNGSNIVYLYGDVVLKSEETPPYHIVSRNAVYDKIKHTAIFTGNAVATRGENVLTGDKIVLYLDKNNSEIMKLISHGSPATYSTQTKKEKERLNARADIIQYEPKITLATLIHHANVTQGINRIAGGYLTYNIHTEVVKSNPYKKNEKTKITLQPEDVY